MWIFLRSVNIAADAQTPFRWLRFVPPDEFKAYEARYSKGF